MRVVRACVRVRACATSSGPGIDIPPPLLLLVGHPTICTRVFLLVVVLLLFVVVRLHPPLTIPVLPAPVEDQEMCTSLAELFQLLLVAADTVQLDVLAFYSRAFARSREFL